MKRAWVGSGSREVGAIEPGLRARAYRRRFLGAIGATALAAAVVVPGRRLQMASALGSRSRSTGFVGRVTDIVSERPVPGAVVWARPAEVATTADDQGTYVLDLPPGVYDLEAVAPGYIGSLAPKQQVNDGMKQLPFGLFPEKPDAADLARAYDRIIKQPYVLPIGAGSPVGAESAVLSSLPSGIRVRWPDYREEMVDLEDYVKGVVPNEVPASWPDESLKAQAVAARSYGVSYFQQWGFVWTDTRCQVYNPLSRTTKTDAAVEATRGVVATSGGTVIRAYFFAKCNGVTTRNSEDAYTSVDHWATCSIPAPRWGYVAYCRARPCGGHTPYTSSCGYYGHGVGMCQWGAYARALPNEGLGYQDILGRYYTGTSPEFLAAPHLLSPPSGLLVLAGATVRLAWDASGAECLPEVTPEGGPSMQPPGGWGPTTYWDVGPLARGTYRWKVRARNSVGEGPWSEERALHAVDHIYATSFPLVRN